MEQETLKFGHCEECGRLWPLRKGREPECRVCGERLLRLRREPDEAEQSEALFEDWVTDMRERGEWGPSPLRAQHILGCGRATVDTMVANGVLHRNEYDRDGHKIVVISWKSIKRAEENKARIGSYTGKSVGRPKVEPPLPDLGGLAMG